MAGAGPPPSRSHARRAAWTCLHGWRVSSKSWQVQPAGCKVTEYLTVGLVCDGTSQAPPSQVI
jgi:hypothetical protein